MTFAEHPPASDDEREALEFLKSGRKLRGFSPAQFQRVERRLESPRRLVRRQRWLPVLAALAVAFVAGAALAHVAGFLPLPFIGPASPPPPPSPTPHRQRMPVARPANDVAASPTPLSAAPASPLPAATPVEKPRPIRSAMVPPSSSARARADLDVERSQSPAAPRVQMRSGEPRVPYEERAATSVPALAPPPAPTMPSPTFPVPTLPAPALPAPAVPAPTGLASSRSAPARPSPEEDAITAESRSFSAALAEWHRDHDAAAALAALDLHERRFAHGQIRLEAKLLRAEIVLQQGREREALSLLDSVTLAGLPRGRELETVRGELRVKHGRCSEGRRDLEHVLAKDRTDALARRATRALALCP